MLGSLQTFENHSLPLIKLYAVVKQTDLVSLVKKQLVVDSYPCLMSYLLAQLVQPQTFKTHSSALAQKEAHDG